jgi:rod shape-determining protein MreD
VTASDIAKILSNFFFLFLIQIFFFKFGIFGVAFCFPYLFFLLLLPMSTPANFLLIVGFCYGLLIDVFYDSPGLHAAACSLLAYLRPQVIAFITPSGGYDEYTPVSVHILGIRWILLYAGILITAHHLLLFFLEAFSFGGFFMTLFKVILSSLLTTFLFVLMQYLLGNGKSA